MRWRGTWAIIGVYQYGDVVLDGNSAYVCVAQSGSVGQQPSLTPSAWNSLSGAAGGGAIAIPAINVVGNTITVPPAIQVAAPYPIAAPVAVDPTHTYRITINIQTLFNTDPSSLTILFYNPNLDNVIQFFPHSPTVAPNPTNYYGGSWSAVFKAPSGQMQLAFINYSAVAGATTIVDLATTSYVLEDLGTVL